MWPVFFFIFGFSELIMGTLFAQFLGGRGAKTENFNSAILFIFKSLIYEYTLHFSVVFF